MSKIEVEGNEMTQIIKDMLILPYLDIDLKYHNLGIEPWDDTND